MYKIQGNADSGETFNSLYDKYIKMPSKEMKVEIIIGESTTLSNDDLSGINISYDLTDSSAFEFGVLSTAKLSFTCKRKFVIAEGNKLTVKSKLKVFDKDNRMYWLEVPMGIFYVEEIEKRTVSQSITAYDIAYRAANAKLNAARLQAIYDSKKQITIDDIINEINSTNAVTVVTGTPFVDGSTIPDGSMAIGAKVDKLKDVTIRQAVGYLAGLNGGYARISKSTGKVEFFYLQDTTREFQWTEFGNFVKKDYNMKITRLECKTNISDKDVTINSGTGTDVYAFENLLINTQEQLDRILNNTTNIINGLEYQVCSYKLQGDPRFNIGDIITINTKERETFVIENSPYVDVPLKTPIMTLSFSMYTGCSMSISTVADKDRSKTFYSGGTLTEQLGTVKENVSTNTENITNIGSNLDRLYVDVLAVKDLTADCAIVNDLKAAKADITNLNADVAHITDAYITKLEAQEIYVDKGTFNILDANVANIDKLVATKANIADLDAAKADIKLLDADLANINTLLNGNLTSDNIHSLVLSSDKVTVDNGFIKNAMIETVSADKINTGTLNTANVKISSEDGSMVLQGNIQQFIDENDKVRIQIGKDASGKFTFILYDENGTGVLIDEEGIKNSSAIKDGLIVNTHVADNASIDAHKLNIGSLVKVIEDDGSLTLNSSNILMDAEGQTLNVAFNNMNTKIEENDGNTTEAINTLTTALNVEKGRINTLISDTTEIKETIGDQGDSITTLNDNYSSLNQTVNGISSTVGSHTTQIKNLGDEIDKEVSSLNSKIEQTKEDITLSVSETYITKTDSQTNINKAKKEAISTAASDATSKANTAKNDAIKSANSTLTSTIANYYTKSQTDSQINVAKEAINLSVSNTYETKENVTSKITAIESETKSLKQTVSSLVLGTDSISASVKSLEESMVNTTNGLASDISKVQEQVNLAMTSSDVKLEIQKELANGVKKVSTSTGFTFDDKGLTINKSDSEMNTQITEDGMKIYKNNDVMLTANNQGVDAKNLHATTYLIIGGNSRMEDFTENGSKRTAVFWIG